MDYANVKAIILDIEGTTTSISFVKDVLFPFVRKELTAHLDKFWDNEELKGDIALLKEQSEKDKTEGVEGFAPVDDADLKESLVKNVLWQMDQDKKTTALKQLQGHIWRDGYKNGELKGHIYPEVAETLKVWSDGGRKLYIYSSGSVEAQKLLFGHSEAGDLLSLISGHFDTAVGPKTAEDSYKAIAKEIGLPVEELLFLTDVDKEAEAAQGAGLHAVLVVREGNAPLTEEVTQKFQTIKTFGDLIFAKSAKRAKTADESEKEEAPATETKEAEPKPVETMETDAKEPATEETVKPEENKPEEAKVDVNNETKEDKTEEPKVEEKMETDVAEENGKEPAETEVNDSEEAKKEESNKTEVETNGEENGASDKDTEAEVKENGASDKGNGAEKANGVNGKENGTNGVEKDTNGTTEAAIEVKKLEKEVTATPPAVEVAAE